MSLSLGKTINFFYKVCSARVPSIKSSKFLHGKVFVSLKSCHESYLHIRLLFEKKPYFFGNTSGAGIFFVVEWSQCFLLSERYLFVRNMSLCLQHFFCLRNELIICKTANYQNWTSVFKQRFLQNTIWCQNAVRCIA